MKKTEKILSAGIVLGAVAAAATYFLTGKRGEKSREKIAAWTLKVKGEVLAKMRKMKEINQEAYYELVDDIADRYERVEKISAEEIKRLRPELKNAWKHISKELKAK
ncbi:MAG: hypothetical protein COT18_12220 [Elusimicrobia bacterium CG08_land_8_20_14_0_20_59_10]|nr:MAG: hypothetical protein COT18_12220 [Elusimicrobia bacterium CG08_land_8_20_14_0_20_59_10]